MSQTDYNLMEDGLSNSFQVTYDEHSSYYRYILIDGLGCEDEVYLEIGVVNCIDDDPGCCQRWIPLKLNCRPFVLNECNTVMVIDMPGNYRLRTDKQLTGVSDRSLKLVISPNIKGDPPKLG